ncbi:hypothetical protein CHS0354_035181 [Potamilus streckersoni]|uniref:Mitochondria-eating protein C-terminal domain-containing protein n=1 Tax=Potamilus streckersoni TaxID=2493646 RepID=A0AAE0SLX6_9BIVA|nr:hypothetical protein CHS0354_035181 [Potamilus streckersoni]
MKEGKIEHYVTHTPNAEMTKTTRCEVMTDRVQCSMSDIERLTNLNKKSLDESTKLQRTHDKHKNKNKEQRKSVNYMDRCMSQEKNLRSIQKKRDNYLDKQLQSDFKMIQSAYDNIRRENKQLEKSLNDMHQALSHEKNTVADLRQSLECMQKQVQTCQQNEAHFKAAYEGEVLKTENQKKRISDLQPVHKTKTPPTESELSSHNTKYKNISINSEEQDKEHLTCITTLTVDQERDIKRIWRTATTALMNDTVRHLNVLLLAKFHISIEHWPNTSKYLARCIDLCWKMGVQEKPMHLDAYDEKGVGSEKIFNQEKFRAYTQTGKRVAFVVWPALLIHEGGAMLVKGIAQGCQ